MRSSDLKLFEEEDAGNIRRLLGDDSIVKVRPSEEIRRILARDGDASPAKVGCVLSRQEFENQQLWNGEVGNKASVLVLEEEMKGQRYAYLEGIVTFVMAMMKEDREAMDWYMSRIFECKEERGPSYEELAGFLIRDRDPIKFLRHVRFSKIKTVSEGELPNRYKMMVENCLVMA